MGPLQQEIIFGFFTSQAFEVQTLMLVRSLRQFGGELRNLPIWICIPEGQSLSSYLQQNLEDLQVQLLPFQIDQNFSQFPFAAKAAAAAHAERFAEKQHKLLAWHDRTGFVCQAPWAFDLPADTAIAFRPTDIANIGAPFDQPLPPFWEAICKHFVLSTTQFPPITTAIDRKTIHLYINAGLLVVRPEKGILRKWAENLQGTYNLPLFKQFYKCDQRFAIFMHQAVLTAAIVEQTRLEERSLLPENYLFSVDNFFEYPQNQRPSSLDAIITGRFHDFFSHQHWEDLILASEDLIRWFRSQLIEGPYWPIQQK